MAQQRGYTAGMFGVELDGTAAGLAESVAGGDAVADVFVEKVGADGIAHKHLAGVKYEDIALEVGTGMSNAFYDWIAATLTGKHDRKDGAISFVDYTGFERERLSWHNGLISEIGFPALDSAAKDAARLTLKIAPEYTRHVKGSGAKASGTGASKQKKWLPSNFRLTIDGVDCYGVRAVGALTVVRPRDAQGVGELRDLGVEAASLVVPDLVVTVAESHAADFAAWHDDFVIQGKNDQAHEKQGKLEFLGVDMKEVLFTLTFSGLGIFRLSRAKEERGAGAVSLVEAQIYCEQMSLTYPQAVAPVAPPAPAPATEPAAMLVAALRDVLSPRLVAAAGARRPEEIASRLLSTASNDPNGVAPTDRGRSLGATWARERATLDELKQVAAMRDTDWTALTLGDGSSLVAALQEAGIVPDSADGSLTLDRDAFVEELVEGAADVYDEVRPHLREEVSPPS